MFKNYKYYSFMFCIDLLAYLTWEFGKYKNVITRKGIKSPTPSFIPNVMKMLVAEVGAAPNNYYFEFYFESCGSNQGHAPVTVI